MRGTPCSRRCTMQQPTTTIKKIIRALTTLRPFAQVFLELVLQSKPPVSDKHVVRMEMKVREPFTVPHPPFPPALPLRAPP